MKASDIKRLGEAWASVTSKEEELEEAKKTAEDASNDKEDDGEGMDKVDPKAAKKKFKDRKDKDIDNDGDVDDSDEYLHKRRKAIGKAMKKDKPVGNDGEKKAEISRIGEEVEIFEGLTASNWHKKNAWEKALAQFNKAAKGKKGDAIDNAYDSLYQTMRELGSKQMVDYHKNMSPAEKKKQIRVLKALITKALDRSQAASIVREDVEIFEGLTASNWHKKNAWEKTLAQFNKAAKGKKGDAVDNAYDSLYQTMRELGSKGMVDYHKNMSPAEKRKELRVLKALIAKALDRSQAASMVKEEIELGESTDELLNMLESAAKAQKANATKPEEIMDKESPKSKQFAKDHEKSDKKIEDNEEDGHDKVTAAGRATKAKSGKRPQDNQAGDKDVVKSTEASAKGQMEA